MEPQTELASDDDKAEKAREALLDMMGQGKPKADDGEKLMKLKKSQAKKVAEKRTNIDDDYLAGPLTIDTYAVIACDPSWTCSSAAPTSSPSALP